MNGGKKLDQITLTVRNFEQTSYRQIYVDVFDTALAHKWLHALEHLVVNNFHLEKNYCWIGWPDSPRNGAYILNQANASIDAINSANLGYVINDKFLMEDCIDNTADPYTGATRNLVHARMNQLHRYFEDLQGHSGNMSTFWQKADPEIRWHIRQLNLLCHEFECWALSWRKQLHAPDWVRPSTLMCWLGAPRFTLDKADLDSFGIDALTKNLGGVYLGVNKAVGKHHWEVFNDEGPDSTIDTLVTSSLRGQSEAAGDFDIEWAQDTAGQPWQQEKLHQFTSWLRRNGFDPNDPELTLGHPKVAQIDLDASFGTDNYKDIWKILHTHLDVFAVSIGDHTAMFDYHWSDSDYREQQVRCLQGNSYV